MKTIRSSLSPSFSSTTLFCREQSTVRTYKTIGNAFRSWERNNIAKVRRRTSKDKALRNLSNGHSRGFNTSLAVANIDGTKDTPRKLVEHDGQWPRLTNSGIARKTCRKFHEQFNHVNIGETAPDDVQVCGRIWGFRVQGNKLAFVDLRQDGVKLQILCNFQELEQMGVLAEDFKHWLHRLKRGDIISVNGRAHRTKRNELSILASELPLVLSSCLQPLPDELPEHVRRQLPHVDLLIRPRAAQILRLGSAIKKFLRMYLEQEGHLSVKTPILAAAVGGAIAKPFKIYSKMRKMALRIAPELWLKRLIMGGFERIYEIGPCFRDEGQFPKSPKMLQRLITIRS